MNIKKTTQIALLLAILLVSGFIITVMAWSKPVIKDPMAVGEIAIPQQDTPKVEIVHSVRGKKALFIGDSHTAADYGWQYQVCKKTGMVMQNTAVGGKQTAWMLEVAKISLSSNYDYCFIYGGANDMAGNREPMKSVRNIQRIVKLCKTYNVKAVVITGFDPMTCVDINGRDVYKGYPQRYAKFQQLLLDSIVDAQVVKTHCISRTDCGDFLCHMTASGHKKMAEAVIKGLALKKI
jgi:lysophospholipase L1-like esterase